MTPGPTYRNFKLEWWTPIKAKREGKAIVARECWTRRWHKEFVFRRLFMSTLSYTHTGCPRMQKKGPPTSHAILEASVTIAITNLKAAGAAIY